nr:MAG TPA: hypothetical protein [Caudoviricetes sp.]
MPAGIQVFDGDSILRLDLTDRVGRVLGAIETGLNSGSVRDAGFLTGKPFFVMRPIAGVDTYGVAATQLQVVGDTLSWYLDPNGAGPGVPPINSFIVYGVF